MLFFHSFYKTAILNLYYVIRSNPGFKEVNYAFKLMANNY